MSVRSTAARSHLSIRPVSRRSRISRQTSGRAENLQPRHVKIVGVKIEMASPDREDLGLGLKPGDPQYRAYVGPPEDYDLVAAMTFNLLTTLGLRQHHSLLDIGCGSLRIGRLLIPYLNQGKYFGVEPNEWLVDEGIRRELGEALVQIKRPTFFFSDSPETIADAKVSFDFAVAQSIFSHCGLDLIKNWLSAISGSLAEDGALVATFLPGEQDAPTRGWVYSECVN